MVSLGSFVGLFLIVMAILAFFLPIFVLRIRNELIELNQKMSRLIELMGGVDPPGVKKIKTCLSCGAKNRQEDFICTNCNKPLV